MLCFVFAALVVVLDQFFKRWIVITLSAGGENVIVPGILSLIYVENTGAAFSILADQRWLLSGIAFAAAIVLILILLRYTEGFWGSLGLAAVLGGTIGNLIDRVFQGYVVDMFRTLFMNFAIFNIADIFITMGFAVFCIHFIASTIRTARDERDALREARADDDVDFYDSYDLPDGKDMPDYEDFSDTKVVTSTRTVTRPADPPPEYSNIEAIVDVYSPKMPEPQPEPDTGRSEPSSWQEYYEPEPRPQPKGDITSALEALSALDALEHELSSIDDYDVDKMLREYGFEEDK